MVKETKKLRGLGAASQETRLRVASAGGNAFHNIRGLQGSNDETRLRVATSGGMSSWKKRKELKEKEKKNGKQKVRS